METDHKPDVQVESKQPDSDASKQGREKNAGAVAGHRKSISGSFSFFRSNSDHGHSSSSKSGSPTSTARTDQAPPSPRSSGAMAMVAQQKSARKRKGSLRKTALLGTGKLRVESKDRRNGSLSLDEGKDLGEEDIIEGHGFTTDSGTLSAPMSPVMPATPVEMLTPRPLPVPPPVPMVTHPIHGDPSKISASASHATTTTITDESKSAYSRTLHWPIAGPGSTSTAQSTASTTDDEESPTSPNAPSLIPASVSSKDTLSTTDSYFPPQPRPVPRTRPTVPKSRSPLAVLPPSIPATPPSEWDYSETRWWGWLILSVTWIVFVVGMGSCFEVWSWAWDVGETPYAPPELHDDPTLPIVGYYPALIILTSVMAWVWVVVAWVGMKYFKHANISGDGD